MFALALITAVAVLLNLMSGAVLTNTFASANSTAPEGIFSLLGHRYVSEGAGTLVVVLALWITFSGKPSRVKIIAWVAVAFVALEAVLGRMGGAPLSHTMGFLHAVVAQILFAMLAHLIVYTSPNWEKEAVAVPDSGWPSLTGLANYTVGALMLQVILGAAFRHDLLSVLWHILCAFVVVIFAIGMVVMATQVPANRPLRPAAIWLVCLVGVQIGLGMILISISQPTSHPGFAEFSVAAHVLVGASALGVGVVNSMQVRKSVKAAPAAAPATS